VLDIDVSPPDAEPLGELVVLLVPFGGDVGVQVGQRGAPLVATVTVAGRLLLGRRVRRRLPVQRVVVPPAPPPAACRAPSFPPPPRCPARRRPASPSAGLLP